MKKIIFKISILFIISVFYSCEKFLEREPIGRIGKEALFSDVNGARLALNGSYNHMLSYYRKEYGMYADIASDNVFKRVDGPAVMLSQFDFVSNPEEDEAAVGHIWQSILESLNNVNNVLNALPGLASTYPNQIAEIERIKGQALVLRAICHFDLCKTFAQPYNFTSDASHPGVPVLLKTPAPGTLISREPVKNVYNQIIADLNESLPLLKTHFSKDQAIVNYYAAVGLLSRVYLYMGESDKCIAAANEVIADNVFSLASATEYAEVFLKETIPGPSKEVLFHLSGKGIPNTISSMDINSAFSDSSGAYIASNKLIELFDENDIRKSTMFTVRKTPGVNYGTMSTKKYANGKVSKDDPFYVKVIRLSEVYLNRAEAKFQKGLYPEAAEDIRIISQRSHPSQTISITYNTPQELEQIIQNERNRELCFEGHRLFDLTRTKKDLVRGAGCNSSVCLLTYPNNKFILPIPRPELDANKGMKQNPGYDN
ncbi:RagB/SusD family nutrient uptake outer membrane protein [Desertivirga xinjiangensis]|uniref:RagB/SusD family nutrient uptake outer membrane protein n=1 Tax=Desertivirga xinjiangensis TaxID=539206 RepID=UPI002108A9D4|nr:RagB/SusD family nutrient uptake outer membrane protein [Pedobacter xinjiangensis]